MDRNEKAIDQLKRGITDYVDNAIRVAPMDKTVTAIVKRKVSDNNYEIMINNQLYSNVHTIGGECKTNETVRVLIPQNNYTNMVILKGGSGEGGGSGDTVNDGKLTIKVNDTIIQNFTANQSTDVTANIEVPTNTSDLENDSDFVTSTTVDDKIEQAIDDLPKPMIFKGSLGVGGTITTLPQASSSNEGYTYKVITDGTYDEKEARVGDTFISNGSTWVLIPSGDDPSGTVTSVGISVPNGLQVSNSPITESGTIEISYTNGYSIPTNAKQNSWDNKLDYDNPTGVGALSLNRKENSTRGNYSVAVGYNNIASGISSNAEGQSTSAIGKNSHAEGYKSVAKGDNSHAEGSNDLEVDSFSFTLEDEDEPFVVEGTYANGIASHAEGNITLAYGDYSHSEGAITLAQSDNSHAEGCLTRATGISSHAEGEYSEAYGDYSHAEGYQTKANRHSSHSEGMWSQSNGRYSHAEGNNTRANGENSHAEGGATIASGNNQHAQGKYNIEDTENKYAHIVGNGTSNASRSNAHTLDWNGNAWFSGDVVGNKDGVEHKLSNKVEKESGKGLSTNDFTTTYKNKIDNLPTSYAPTNAERNVIVGVQKNGTDLTIDSNRKVNVTVPTQASDINAVPTTRKVNNHALSADITITKDDIGLGNVDNKSSATIRSELTKDNVTNALGYTPPTTDTNTTYSLTQDSTDGHKIILTPSVGSAQTVTIPDNNTTYTLGTNVNSITLTSSVGNTQNITAPYASRSGEASYLRSFQARVDGTNNYPYRRIASTQVIISDYVDRSCVLLLTGGYAYGNYGIIKVDLRTNGASSGQLANAEAKWLVRKGFNANQITIGYNNTSKNSYLDVYYVSNNTYASITVTPLFVGGRGIVDLSAFDFYYTRETSTEIIESYSSITTSTTTPRVYTNVDSATDGGTVAISNRLTTTTIGNATTPIYLSNGYATALNYTIAKSVPSDAVFTDTNTTYRFFTGDSNGQIKVSPSNDTAYNVDVKGLGSIAYKNSLSSSDVGLGNVGNFKAVSTVANQGLTETEKANARANIGVSSGGEFSGSYNDLTNKPYLNFQQGATTISFELNNASTNRVDLGNKTFVLTNPSPIQPVVGYFEVTFNDSKIDSTVCLDLYCSKSNVNYTSATVTNGSVTFAFNTNYTSDMTFQLKGTIL